jgi:hypothetical protein
LTKNKYIELRKKRLREREERFRRERERIRKLKEKEQALRLKKWKELVARRREIEKSLLEKTRLEEERQEKAKDALYGVKKALEEIERKASIYVPETMKKINEMLMDADKSFESTDYEKTFKLSHEIKELLEKTRLEALKKAEEKEKRREEEGKYFYCVIPCNEEKNFGQIGINDEGVYTIPYRHIAAVVSDSPIMDYEMTEDNIRRHEAVLRQVMECHTVVPVEFGTTIKNKKILGRLLTKAYEPTRECLGLVDNMVELGVKVILNGDIVFADPEKRKENASDILGSLSTIAKQAVAGDLFSDRLILNTSFLVNKKDTEVFSNEVARLQEKYPMLKLLYSGPWPPHNFVYIKIGTEGMELSKR